MAGDVDKIKARLTIEDVVGSYIELQKAGKYLKASSPFANDSNPSFYVSPEKGLYHCFSTDKGGDIFTFIQEVEGVEFREALEILADRAGVELSGSGGDSGQMKRLRSVVGDAVSFFEETLQSKSDGKEYLRSRSITEKTARQFELGQAPDAWRDLLSHLKEKGYTTKDIIAAGLAKKPDNGKSPYDRFRNRLMFPIRDTAGRPIAFSGRRLDEDDPAKYINSPETPLFKKKQVLYGYYFAKETMRQLDASILVEGQTDLVLSHQAGFTNTVASSGTSITEDQLSLIQRLTDNLILALDTDTAGMESTLKVARLALSMGMTPKVVDLPEDSDPADIISEGGADKFKQAISEADHVISVAVNWTQKGTEDRRDFLSGLQDRVFPLLSSIDNDITRDHFVSRVADQADIREKTLRSELSKLHQEKATEKTTDPKTATDRQSNPLTRGERKQKIHQKLKALCQWQAQKEEPDVDVESVKQRLDEIQDYDLSTLNDESMEESKVLAMEVTYESTESKRIKRDVEELLLHLEEQVLADTYKIVSRQIAKETDREKKQALLEKCQNISNRIHTLRDKIDKHV